MTAALYMIAEAWKLAMFFAIPEDVQDQAMWIEVDA